MRAVELRGADGSAWTLTGPPAAAVAEPPPLHLDLADPDDPDGDEEVWSWPA